MFKVTIERTLHIADGEVAASKDVDLPVQPEEGMKLYFADGANGIVEVVSMEEDGDGVWRAVVVMTPERPTHTPIEGLKRTLEEYKWRYHVVMDNGDSEDGPEVLETEE